MLSDLKLILGAVKAFANAVAEGFRFFGKLIQDNLMRELGERRANEQGRKNVRDATAVLDDVDSKRLPRPSDDE